MADTTEPIVLEPLKWCGTDRTRFSFNGIYVTRKHRMIKLFDREITADTALGLAKVLATMAQDAKDEPDPAEVQRLYTHLHVEVCGGALDQEDAAACDCARFAKATLRFQKAGAAGDHV